MITHWQWCALGSAFFAGLTAVLLKWGLAAIPSNTATLIRTLMVCGFLSVFVALRHEWVNPFVLDKRGLAALMLSALATTISWLLYFRALENGSVSVVASLDKLSLLFTVILSVLFFGERLGLMQCSGVVLMLVGAVLVALK